MTQFLLSIGSGISRHSHLITNHAKITQRRNLFQKKLKKFQCSTTKKESKNPTANSKSKVHTTTTASSATTKSAKESSNYSSISLASVIPASFFIGASGAFCGSLVGMGGGFLFIPLMTSKILRLNVSQHIAHGTSLFAVAVTGISGGLGYANNMHAHDDDKNKENKTDNSIHMESVAMLALTGMFTARFGAQVANKLSARTLKTGLGILLISIAPVVPLKKYLVERSDSSCDDHNKNKSNNMNNNLLTPAFIGLGAGFVSGVFGVGGGAITVPSLTFFSTEMDHYQALGTSLCAMSLPAVVGTFTHYQNGNVALRIAVPLAMGAFAGGYTGGKIGSDIDEDKLRWGFFTILLSLGAKNIYGSLRILRNIR